MNPISTVPILVSASTCVLLALTGCMKNGSPPPRSSVSTTNEGCGMHGGSSVKGARTCGSNTPVLVEAVDPLHEPRYVGAKPAASKFVGVTLRMRSETAVSKADLENLVACMLSSSEQSAKTDLVRNTSLRTEVYGSFYRVDVLAPSSEEANAVYDRVKEFVARP